MRKLLPLLLLFLISGASAITASLEIDKIQVTLDGSVTLLYSFSLDQPASTNFSAYANDILIFNHTTLDSVLSSDYEWNVSNTPAGTYTIRFLVETQDGETASTTETLEITPEPHLTMVTSDTLHAFDNITTKVYNLQNTGNIPLEVSIVPTRLYSVAPLFFALDVDQTQDITVQVQRSSSMTSSLAVRGQNDTHIYNLNLNINIIVPSVAVNLTDVYSFTTDEFSGLHVKVENNGNIDQNFTFTLSTGEETFERFLEVEAGQGTEHNFTLPTSAEVKTVTMNYVDSDGSTATETVQLVSSSFFDSIMDLFGDNTTRGIIITFLIIFVVYMLWKIARR
jgi:hypothetical protein